MAFLVTSHSSQAGQWIEMPKWCEATALAAFPEKARTGDLLKTALKALGFFPPLYIQSVLGPAHTWFRPHRKHSEFQIIDLWRAFRTLRYLRDLYVPSVPREPSDVVRSLLPPLVSSMFYHPTRFFEHRDETTIPRDFPDERWFFINGVATNRAVAEMNAALLSRIFGRSFTVIQNSTNSLALDLAQCVIGKEYKTRPNLNSMGTMTEPALKATLAVLAALNQEEVRKVVVVAHSQGTIIMANALRAIVAFLRAVEQGPKESATVQASDVAASLTFEAKQESELALRVEVEKAFTEFVTRTPSPLDKVRKLEVYTFANCADKMKYAFTDSAGKSYPFMEHFANERDLVARLGVLAPCREEAGCTAVEIDGPVYERKGHGRLKRGAWGHLLNEHYLFPVEDYLKRGRHGSESTPYPPRRPHDAEEPRLYSYFGGR